MITEIAIAQQQFFLKHGKFPPPYNTGSKKGKAERDEFLELAARQYLTGHGHALAAENSKGCDGLKNVVDVLGKDLCKKIEVIAPQYGINLDNFHPIKTTQKVAGLNKLNLKKLKVSIENFVSNAFNNMTKKSSNAIGQSEQYESVPPARFNDHAQVKEPEQRSAFIVGYHRFVQDHSEDQKKSKGVKEAEVAEPKQGHKPIGPSR